MSSTRVPAPKTKQSNASIAEGDFFGTRLTIPDAIMAELDKKGLVPRFVSAKTMNDNSGRHPKGWQPYILENPVTNLLTNTTDNIYRIGDLILAVKTKEAHANHRKYLDDKARRQSMAAKDRADEMKKHIQDSKGDKYIKIVEGYEENE